VNALYFAEPAKGRQEFAEIARAIGSGNESALAEAIAKEKGRGGMEMFMTNPLTAKRLERLMMIRKGLAG